MFKIMPQGSVSSLTLSHSVIGRDQNHMDIPHNTTLVHYTHGMLTGLEVHSKILSLLRVREKLYEYLSFLFVNEVFKVFKCPEVQACSDMPLK